jgi:hypothetical protein
MTVGTGSAQRVINEARETCEFAWFLRASVHCLEATAHDQALEVLEMLLHDSACIRSKVLSRLGILHPENDPKLNDENGKQSNGFGCD